MTTDDSIDTTTEPEPFVQLPDPPEESKDGMVFDHLGKTGNAHFLAIYLGNRDTTLMGSSLYISPVVTDDPTGLFAPDLFVSFNGNRENYYKRNGYIISEQSKPPDFVLEIASWYTGDLDATVKRDAYAALGISEYWRFDPTGEYNGTFLAADRLVDGGYQPIAIAQLGEEIRQGYSTVLKLDLRWEQGELRWHDPATGRHILTYDDQRDRADAAEALALSEREARFQAEARAEQLEAELRRLREGQAQ